MIDFFHIEHAREEDLGRILEIFEAARGFMRRTGNPNQWNGPYPSAEILQEDIQKSQLFAMRMQDEIEAVFALVMGEDPTYSFIENGKWLSDLPYGTIHRIASSGKFHRVFQTAADFSFAIIPHLRVDTHEDNRIMQRVILKNGFQRCGIIYLQDGSPRIAYEKVGEEAHRYHAG